MSNKYLEKIAGKPLGMASAVNVGEGIAKKLNEARDYAKFIHHFQNKFSVIPSLI
jgi:hypothetical protein